MVSRARVALGMVGMTATAPAEPACPGDQVTARPTTMLGAVASAAVGPSSNGWQQQITLGARVRRGAASLELAGGVQRPRELAVAGGRVHVSTASVTAVPCAVAGAASACALLTVGRITGRGDHLPGATTERMSFAALGGRLAWERALGPAFGVRVAIDVDAPLI